MHTSLLCATTAWVLPVLFTAHGHQRYMSCLECVSRAPTVLSVEPSLKLWHYQPPLLCLCPIWLLFWAGRSWCPASAPPRPLVACRSGSTWLPNNKLRGLQLGAVVVATQAPRASTQPLPAIVTLHNWGAATTASATPRGSMSRHMQTTPAPASLYAAGAARKPAAALPPAPVLAGSNACCQGARVAVASGKALVGTWALPPGGQPWGGGCRGRGGWRLAGVPACTGGWHMQV